MSDGIHDSPINITGGPMRTVAPLGSQQRVVSLRWFVKTRWYKNWDDRDKVWVETEYTDAPVLQYHDGQDWKELPTHRVTVAG